MVKVYNAPVTIQTYLGSGKKAEKVRENLMKIVGPGGSLSELVVAALKKAHPAVFKGGDDGKK